MRLVVLLLLAVLPAQALADGWRPLKGPEIVAALTARVVGFADGTTQEFKPGGVTLATAGAGRWTVDGDRYCSAWPPGDAWTCYGVEREAQGLDIRFTGVDGSVTVGRYVDLQ